MKPCNNCKLEQHLHRIKADGLLFCSHKCFVDFVEREKHPLLKSETYAMYKKIVAEEAVQNKGCGKPSCCQVKTCICKSFNPERLLKEALK